MNKTPKSADEAANGGGIGGDDLHVRTGNSLSRKFPRPTEDSILVCTVGGVGQIGMNWTLYGHAGKWVLVDAGSAFAPRDVEGVDAIFPDPRSLKAILPNLEALIVTHAHEDHIGAIHRLWPALRAPIYATPFATKVISNRLRELGTLGKVKIKTYDVGDTLKVGPFDVQTIRMTHSVPECVALAFKTPAGTVLHTGDWKIDPDPVIGKPTDIDALKALGKEGVLGMVCDSTNADRYGEITSEAMVAQGMREVFAKSKGMTVVTCFASNVARLASVARAAAATGRKVAVAGRSLIRTEEAARECGLLDGVPEFLHDVSHLKGLDRRQMALICTGSQGEGNAALARLASGNDTRLPNVKPGDVVVHSARVIPGNEVEVEEIFAALEARGVKVLREEFNGFPLHVSGHAKANEIETMYSMIRPRFAIPVHGEKEHLEAHERIAKASRVREVELAAEGDVLRVSRRRIQKVASVKIDLLCALSTHRGVRLAMWDAAKQEAVPFPSPGGSRNRPKDPKRPGDGKQRGEGKPKGGRRNSNRRRPNRERAPEQPAAMRMG